MKRLPVFETTKYAYKFFFANFGKFIPLLLQYSGVHFLLYTFLYLIKNHFNASDVLVSWLYSIVEYLILCLALPIEINVIRAIVNKEKVEKHFFKSLLSSRTWRVVLIVILCSLIIMIPLGLIGLVYFVHVYFNFQEAVYNAITNILMIFNVILCFYLIIRLFLTIVTAALDHDKPIRDAWKMTKGSLLRLSAITILTFIPGLVLSSCFMLIFKFPMDIKHSNPLIYGFISLPIIYIFMLFYAGLAHAYVHLNKYNNNE